MSNQTPLFFEIIRRKVEVIGLSKIKPIVHPPPPEDKFSNECKAMCDAIADLKRYLVKIRPAYLSTSRRVNGGDSLTDKDRENIDYESRTIIQRKVTQLESLEKMEKQVALKHKNRSAMQKLLSDPIEDGTKETVQLHRQGVFIYLREKLKEVSDLQASQQEIRLSRQIEKSKSTLHNVPDTRHASNRKKAIPFQELERQEASSGDSDTFDGLSPQLIQELEAENHALLDELEMSLDRAKSAEKSMIEISQLQTTLATHLASQSEQIQSMMNEAFDTSGDVTAANKQLDSARSRNRRTSKMIIYGSLIIALVLLFNDWLL